jgi:hypothetical protein
VKLAAWYDGISNTRFFDPRLIYSAIYFVQVRIGLEFLHLNELQRAFEAFTEVCLLQNNYFSSAQSNLSIYRRF